MRASRVASCLGASTSAAPFFLPYKRVRQQRRLDGGLIPHLAYTSAQGLSAAATSEPGSARRQPVCHAAATSSASSQDVGLFGGEDFYTILGVTPSAELRDIKRAYHGLIREFHPDRMSGSEESQQLCALLNEIYETLSDETSRAVYNTLAGFSIGSINPFLDGSFVRDQVFVDEITCIGCGKCVRSCSTTFEIEASKYGRARVISQTAAEVEEVQIAIETCPVDCIHWVSLPQLSLLETALGSMARIEVSVMQRFGRSGGNVFEVAYRAWERRQAQIRERAAAAEGGRRNKQQVDWSFWTAASLQYEEDAQERTAAMDPAQRKIANLAASAARAARLWRFYIRRSTGSLLTDLSSASMSSYDA